MHDPPLSCCLISSAISLAQELVLSAWYTAPVNRAFKTAAMSSLTRETLNLQQDNGGSLPQLMACIHASTGSVHAAHCACWLSGHASPRPRSGQGDFRA